MPRVYGENFSIINSDLSGAYFRNWYVTSSDWENVVMSNSRKENCWFQKCNFSNVYLINSDFPNSTYIDGNIKYSVIQDVDYGTTYFNNGVKQKNNEVYKVRNSKSSREIFPTRLDRLKNFFKKSY